MNASGGHTRPLADIPIKEEKMISYSRFTLSIPTVILVAFACFVIFAAGVGGPIFGSDEYVYFISGKFNHQLETLYQLDPGLQRVSNFLYFSLVHACTALVGEHFLTVYRIVHAIEFVAAVCLVCSAVRPLLGQRRMLLSVVCCLMFPAHIYLYAVMPEVDLMLLAAILGFSLVRIYPARSLCASAFAGAALGAAILIKPHAIALLLAAVAAQGLMWMTGVGPRRLSAVVGNCLLMLASTYVTLIVLAFAATGNWSLDPTVALGLKFYGKYLDNSAVQVSLLSKVISALHYLLANLVVVALVFAPALAWSAGHLLRHLRERHSDAPLETALASFVLAMLASHLAMTAWFTAGAAAINEGEAMRLHGRYLSAALIWLPPVYLFALTQWSPRLRKLCNAVLAGAVLLLLLLVVPKFKIYPWDHPLLMAFFNPKNWYQWTHGGALPYLGMVVTAAVIAGLLLSVYKREWQSRILIAQLLLILGAGLLQNYSWLWVHLSGTREASQGGQTLGMLLGDKQMGRGVLVTEERYGRASYLLFGLANAPKVIARPAGEVVTSQDVAGANWVIIDGNYKLQFDYKASMTFKQLRLITLRGSPVAVVPHAVEAARLAAPKTVMAEGEALSLTLTQSPDNGVLLTGFNEQEDWGAWTSEPKAEVVLPRLLEGKLRLTLFGWSLPENLGAPMQLKAGDKTYPLALTGAPQDIVLEVSLAKPTDRLAFESGVFKPANSARTLGVAIGRINIERLKK
ncbi:hypothetical protein [Pseudoduganella sp. HUAS MS19]